MKMYTFEYEELNRMANEVYQHSISILIKEGFIHESQHNLVRNRIVLVSEKGMFGKLWDRWFENKDDNTLRINLIGPID